ncbi:hypothetical protein [Clostridium cellulovorans]|nr:hypothetical protein [Clostridium cellulovorans]
MLTYVKNETSFFEEGMLARTGGVDKWFNDLKESIQDNEKLRETVNQQVIKLKLEKLPVRSILY